MGPFGNFTCKIKCSKASNKERIKHNTVIMVFFFFSYLVWNLFDFFFFRRVKIFCFLGKKGGCFFTFFEKDGGNFELECY